MTHKFLELICSKSEDDFHDIITFLGIKFKKFNDRRFRQTTMKELSHIKQLKFIIDSYLNVSDCKQASGHFRHLQIIRLKGLKLVIKILEKHNLSYWLDFGTLIGAYRHKGFIPWDDDIDISMLREEYEKAKIVLADYFKGTSFTTDLGGKKTAFLLRIIDPNPFFILVDIFPYDYSDDENILPNSLHSKLISLRREFLEENPPKHIWKNKIDPSTLFERLKKYYSKNGVITKSKHNFIFKGIETQIYDNLQTIQNFDDVFPLKELPFEDFMAKVPNNTLKYLENCDDHNYGNIMQFPPLSAMCSHSVYNKFEKPEFIEQMNRIEKELDNLLSKFD